MKNLVIILLLVGTNLTTYFLLSNRDDIDVASVSVSARLQTVPESEEDALVEHVVEVVTEMPDSRSSLAEVGDAILGLEKSPLRGALLELLASGWFDKDHVALAEWLNDQPFEVDADHALASFANLASELDPEGSIEWAASVIAPKLREQALGRSAREYARLDPRGYKEFIDSNSPSVRAILSLGLADGYQDESTELAYRYDILEEDSEPISSILARRTRLAGSSARVNNVELTLD